MNAQDLALTIVCILAIFTTVTCLDGVIEWARTQRNRRKISQTMLKLAQQEEKHAIKEKETK